MHEIRKGLGVGVDVSYYEGPEYDSWQIEQIREGLEKGKANQEIQNSKEGAAKEVDVEVSNKVLQSMNMFG